jgi:hypothetical protein
VSLLRDLCRAFNARERAMLCAMSHGQLTIDGYVIRPEHLGRWTESQLRGRYARLHDRTVRLYGSTPAGR